jgi:hypothetical protein
MGDVSSVSSGSNSITPPGLERVKEQNQENARKAVETAQENRPEPPERPEPVKVRETTSESPARDTLENIQASREASTPRKEDLVEAPEANQEENTITQQQVLETAEQVIGQTLNLEA